MPDLTAASYQDVVDFFKMLTTRLNASLVVAGDIDTARTKALVEKWFSDVKPGPAPTPITIPGVALTTVQRKTITDKVQLPRLYLAWITPRHLEPGDAALDVVADVLAGGKNSRLYKRLVYDLQIAQDVSAFQVRPRWRRPSRSPPRRARVSTVEEVAKVIDEEIDKLQREDPSAHEVQRSLNQFEASFYNRLERLGSFGGKADQINADFSETGDPNWFNQDLGRYRALTPASVRAAAAAFLPKDRRVELTVMPEPGPNK
jgi:zinc protease